jgi:hypothetical protein
MARERPRGARTWQFIRPAAHARDHAALGGVDSRDSLLGANQIQGCFWGGGLGCDGTVGFERRGGFLPRSSHKFRFGHAVGPAVWLGSARVVRTKTSRVGPLLKQIATFLLRARSRLGPQVHARRVFLWARGQYCAGGNFRWPTKPVSHLRATLHTQKAQTLG